jgi:hypothetical protein
MVPTVAPTVAPGDNPVSLNVDITLLGLTAESWNINRAASETAFKKSMLAQMGVPNSGSLEIIILSVTTIRASVRRGLQDNPGALMVVKTQVTGKVEGADDTTISNSLVKSLFDDNFTRVLSASAPIFQGVVVEKIMPPVPASPPVDSNFSKSGSNTGSVVGGVCAALLVLAGAGYYYYYKKKKMKMSKDCTIEVELSDVQKIPSGGVVVTNSDIESGTSNPVHAQSAPSAVVGETSNPVHAQSAPSAVVGETSNPVHAQSTIKPSLGPNGPANLPDAYAL